MSLGGQKLTNRRFGESVHYGTKHLSTEELVGLCRDCREHAYHIAINKLDCSASLSRTSCDLTFDEILGLVDENTHFVVIDRGTWRCPLFENREHFDVGFRTMTGPVDYFLFIHVETDKMGGILEKYGLREA